MALRLSSQSVVLDLGETARESYVVRGSKCVVFGRYHKGTEIEYCEMGGAYRTRGRTKKCI